MSERPVLLETDHLTKHFVIGRGQEVHAVDGVSLAIHEQEIVGLVGESGSGKSTYGKTVVGLHDKTSGTVKIFGHSIDDDFNGPPGFVCCHRRRWASDARYGRVEG